MHDIYSHIDSLQQCKTVEDIHDVCSVLCNALGFDYFHYGARIPVSLNKPHYIFISGYPDEWWERYNEEEYLLNDPSVRYCSRNITPLIWNNLFDNAENVDGDISIIEEAKKFGLKHGLSVPVHSSRGELAIFSVVAQDENSERFGPMEQRLVQVNLYAKYVHEAVRRVLIDKEMNFIPDELSPREKECLLWAAEGKTTWETSKILNISERTVLFHLQNTMKKLNVTNKSHAVARAILMRVI